MISLHILEALYNCTNALLGTCSKCSARGSHPGLWSEPLLLRQCGESIRGSVKNMALLQFESGRHKQHPARHTWGRLGLRPKRQKLTANEERMRTLCKCKNEILQGESHVMVIRTPQAMNVLHSYEFRQKQGCLT